MTKISSNVDLLGFVFSLIAIILCVSVN